MKRLGLDLTYLAAFFLLLLSEVLIALFVHDRFVRPYVGDVLVVLVLYCLVRAAWKEPSRLLPLWVFLFAALVECGQYLSLAERLGLDGIPVLRIALGSTFDWMDLVCYAVGSGISLVWQSAERRRKEGR